MEKECLACAAWNRNLPYSVEIHLEKSYVAERAFPLIRILRSTQNSKIEICPKAYPEEMEVIRTLNPKTGFGTLFIFACGFSP